MKKITILKAVSAALVCAAVLIGALFTGCENQLLEDPASRQGANGQARNGKAQAAIPIASDTDLAKIGVDSGYPLNGSYILEGNVVLSDPSGWTPIGTRATPFTGTFDGDGWTITLNGFSGTALDGQYLGIFASVTGDIFNLTVTASNVSQTATTDAALYAGVLTGYAGSGASFQNITVSGNFAINCSDSDHEVTYIGGVTGYAVGSTFLNINTSLTPIPTGTGTSVYVGGVAGIADSSTLSTITGSTVINFTATSSYLYIGKVTGNAQNGTNLGSITVSGPLTLTGEGSIIRTGGVTGLLDSSALNGGSSSVSVTISSTVASGRRVYAGGAVGYGQKTFTAANTISNFTTTGDVSITNGMVDTSAGGLSGYTQKTDIADCSATGDISVTIGRAAMIYVGGLAGYAAGDADGGTTAGSITRSYATGKVSATSNYPYAGGLVGYNYTGNVVTKCYATGEVTAIGNLGTDKSYPYAGGLAGYNSGGGFTKNQTTLEDCYATGNVTVQAAWIAAWAGGITGSNAADAIVNRCYYAEGEIIINATTVPAGPLDDVVAGGIVGYNYYGAPRASNSIALNRLIKSSSALNNNLHRVAGANDSDGILNNNYALDTMTIVPTPTTSYIGADRVDGANQTGLPTQTFYENTLHWTFGTGGTWKMVTGNLYPLLQWQQ